MRLHDVSVIIMCVRDDRVTLRGLGHLNGAISKPNLVRSTLHNGTGFGGFTPSPWRVSGLSDPVGRTGSTGRTPRWQFAIYGPQEAPMRRVLTGQAHPIPSRCGVQSEQLFQASLPSAL